MPTRYERYWASDLGYVFSLKSGQRLATHPNPPYGHLRISFWIDGRPVKRLLHNVILESFVGPRPPGMMGLHWDDDPTHNALSNLRWGTPTENNLDALRNGRNVNRNKVECPVGHEYTDENTWWYRGYRYCRACRRDRAKMKKASA